jgi:hypothetical protein
VTEDAGAEFVGQVSPFDSSRLPLHHPDPVKENHFSPQLNAQAAGEEWVGRDNFSGKDLAGNFMTAKFHLLSKTVEVLGGLEQAVISDKCPHAVNGGEDAFVDQVAEGMPDGVAPDRVHFAQLGLGGETFVSSQLTAVYLAQDGVCDDLPEGFSLWKSVHRVLSY